jgi:hypothetical protein
MIEQGSPEARPGDRAVVTLVADPLGGESSRCLGFSPTRRVCSPEGMRVRLVLDLGDAPNRTSGPRTHGEIAQRFLLG